MTTPIFYQLHDLSSQKTEITLQKELTASLLATQATVSPKYLYDAMGSRLFDAITELTEYYPTRTEGRILSDQLSNIALQLPKGAVLVDLGAGSCEKAERLFSALQPSHYVPVDISIEYLRKTVSSLQRQYPEIRMSGVGMDFSSELALPPQLLAEISKLPIIVFYPGSSIGNFAPDEARTLLNQVQVLCSRGASGGGLLIGVDLVKPSEILQPAYADALGVTASFNLNMLLNINKLLGSDFRLCDWEHRALFDEKLSRIEMHLDAKQDLIVNWQTDSQIFSRVFKKGESIHTENSYKWTVAEFNQLLKSANFKDPTNWTDSKGWYAVAWAPA